MSSGGRAKVGECVLDTLAGMAEQLCRLCVLVRRMCGLLTSINCSRCRKNSCGWQQSLRGLQMMCITKNFDAADGQVLPKNLDISRDPPPPSVDESTQTTPGERAERRDRFESRSSGPGAQTSLDQPRNTEISVPPEESMPRGRESETVHGPSGESQGRELLKMTPHHLPRKNELNPMI